MLRFLDFTRKNPNPGDLPSGFFGRKNTIPKPPLILGDIDRILRTHENSEIIDSVCALTSWDRDSWTDARRHLVESGNEKALKEVDEALFCIGQGFTNIY